MTPVNRHVTAGLRISIKQKYASADKASKEQVRTSQLECQDFWQAYTSHQVSVT